MVTLTELIESLHRIFAEDQVNVDEVIMLMKTYNSNPAEWRQYAVFDEHKYTRNLVDIGNGKYNLMILCWGPGMVSSIHDHSNAHCFVKILDGILLETRYVWPDNQNKQSPLKKLNESRYEENSVCYMSDKLGLHRMENPSHSDGAVSLHLYIPPFDACNAFDEVFLTLQKLKSAEREPRGKAAYTFQCTKAGKYVWELPDNMLSLVSQGSRENRT